MAPRPVAQRSRKNNFCCVTTRRCNCRLLRRLRRRLGTLTARPLRLGVLGFDRIILAPFGLPFGRLPAPDQTQAFRVLAVTLIPAPWRVLAPTPFAQADPRPGPSRTAATVWLMMTAAHGRVHSQGSARGGTRERSPRALIQNPIPGGRPPVYPSTPTRPTELNSEGNSFRNA